MDNRKLDMLIAEHVMGWKLFEGEPGYGRPPEKWSRPSLVLDEIPHYSTDIAAAWQVVEHFQHLNMAISVYNGGNFGVALWYGGCTVKILDFKSNQKWEAISTESAPLAICLAALRAVGVEV